MMQYVEFESGPWTLRGMLHLPAGKGPFPAALFLHGLGANRIESHYLFVKLARVLEEVGYASLRFDFGGSGESDGQFEDVTTRGQLADAGRAMDFLRRHPAIDGSRLGVIGLSMGGCVAALLAGLRGGELKAAVLLSAVAEPARLLSYLRTGKLESQLANLGYMDWSGHRISRRFLLDLEGVHGAEAIADFPGPTLLVHGSRDEMVPRSEMESYADARRQKGRPTESESIEDAGHTFASVQWTEQVIGLVSGFVARNV